LLRNVCNKKAYFSGKGVKTSSISAETNTLTTATSETVKLKDSTRCFLDRPADGYNRQKQTRARRRAEQIRTSRAKKTPDRKGTKQIAELGELAVLRREIPTDC
jgi:hypothetical protein